MSPWKEFTDSPRDTHRTDGPPPSVLERKRDDVYDKDFATMVACFRTRLSHTPLGTVMKDLGTIANDGYFLSADQPSADFLAQWGPAKLLRALARAIEEPDHILGDLEGD